MADARHAMVCVAQVGAPHGVRGAFRLALLHRAPENVAAYGPFCDERGRAFVRAAHRSAPAKGGVIATAPGIERPRRRRSLARPALYVPRTRAAGDRRGRVLPRGPGGPRGAPRHRAEPRSARWWRCRITAPATSWRSGPRTARSELVPFTARRRAGGRPRWLARSRWCCRERALDRHRPHHLPGDVPGPARRCRSPARRWSAGCWRLDAVDLRGFTADRHQTVDDTPFGGGAGMVMRPDIVARAVDGWSQRGAPGPLVYLSPRGEPLAPGAGAELAAGPGVVLLCGRYEGVDHRVIEARGFIELSLGDFVLSGGELAAMSLIDACVRLLPGVVGAAASLAEESFAAGLLEYPHYTRPQVWEGRAVPDVLLVGPSRQDRRLAPGAGAGGHEVPAAGSGRDLSAMKPRRPGPGPGAPTRRGCDEPDCRARAGAAGAPERRAPGPRLPARRHAAGQRQGDRGQPRARAGLRGRVHRPAQPWHELRLHRAQDLATARASSACSRCSARASTASRWFAAVASAAPSSIICAAAPASRRASPSAATSGRPPHRRPSSH